MFAFYIPVHVYICCSHSWSWVRRRRPRRAFLTAQRPVSCWMLARPAAAPWRWCRPMSATRRRYLAPVLHRRCLSYSVASVMVVQLSQWPRRRCRCLTLCWCRQRPVASCSWCPPSQIPRQNWRAISAVLTHLTSIDCKSSTYNIRIVFCLVHFTAAMFNLQVTNRSNQWKLEQWIASILTHAPHGLYNASLYISCKHYICMCDINILYPCC